MDREICGYCEKRDFCEFYHDQNCEALNILLFLLDKRVISDDDIKAYRQELLKLLYGESQR